MKRLILLCLSIMIFACNSVEMRNVPLGPSPKLNTRSFSMKYVSYIRPLSNRQEEIRNENIIRFKLRRRIYQPVSVVLQTTAGGLLIGGQYCINKFPETAKILAGVSLGIVAASFVINASLLTVDDKFEEVNNRSARRRQNDIYPTIVQR